MLRSGDQIEVELTVDSANDYEYLVFEDMKAAGLEAIDLALRPQLGRWFVQQRRRARLSHRAARRCCTNHRPQLWPERKSTASKPRCLHVLEDQVLIIHWPSPPSIQLRFDPPLLSIASSLISLRRYSGAGMPEASTQARLVFRGDGFGIAWSILK